MSEWEGVVAAERIAVVFYGMVLLVMVLMLIVLGQHAEREGLFGDDVADERKEEARVKYQLMPSLIAYIVAARPGVLPAATRHLHLPAHRDLAGDPVSRDVRKLFGKSAS